MKTIYSGGEGVTYSSMDEALAAVDVREISAAEYGRRFDSYVPDYGNCIYLDDGEILDVTRDNNSDGSFSVTYGRHSEVVEKEMKASRYGEHRTDYFEIEVQEWDDTDPDDMTIENSTVLGYRKDVYC